MTCVAKGSKYYAIVKGKQPGIYDNWSIADRQVSGFSGATFKGFQSKAAAEKFMSASKIKNPTYYLAVDNPKVTTNNVDPDWSSTSLDSGSDCSQPSHSTPIIKEALHQVVKDAPSCTNCATLTTIIKELTVRLTTVEQQLKTTAANQSAISEAARKSSEDTTAAIDNIQAQLSSIQSQVIEKSNKQPINPAAATYSSVTKQTTNVRQSHNSGATAARKAHATKTKNNFNAEKCFVINFNSKESYQNTNQDKIRTTINRNFGPTMIDLINRYKGSSANPKFIVQLANPDQLDKILQQWDSMYFGGTTVRKTIPPSKYVGMLKGVPISIDNDEVSSDINNIHPNTKVYRLLSGGNKLRTVKLEFNTAEDLQRSINNGILLESSNLLLRVEVPYESNKESNNG